VVSVGRTSQAATSSGCRRWYSVPWVTSAQAVRAFLLASATAARRGPALSIRFERSRRLPIFLLRPTMLVLPPLLEPSSAHSDTIRRRPTTASACPGTLRTSRVSASGWQVLCSGQIPRRLGLHSLRGRPRPLLNRTCMGSLLGFGRLPTLGNRVGGSIHRAICSPLDGIYRNCGFRAVSRRQQGIQIVICIESQSPWIERQFFPVAGVRPSEKLRGWIAVSGQNESSAYTSRDVSYRQNLK